MKNLLRFIGIIIIVIVVLLAFSGLIPGLSSIVGADKPKDLGIKFAAGDPEKIQTKIGPEIISLPQSDSPVGSLKYSGQKPATYTATSEEITALLNFHHWKFNPFSNVQVRVNPDGTVESTGVINADTALAALAGKGIQTTDVRKAMVDYHIPVMTMPFYVKFSGNLQNNTVSGSVSSLQAGRIPVPGNILASNQRRITQAVQVLVDGVPGFFAKSLTFNDGRMSFDGTVPEKQESVAK
jgi:hypothetical protein